MILAKERACSVRQRDTNTAAVMRLLLSAPCSRKDLATLTSLKPPQISNILTVLGNGLSVKFFGCKKGTRERLYSLTGVGLREARNLAGRSQSARAPAPASEP